MMHHRDVIAPLENVPDRHDAAPPVAPADRLQSRPPCRAPLLRRLLARRAAEMARTGSLRRFMRSLRGFCALRYWRGHLKLARVMAQPGLIDLVRCRPRTLFKYLHFNYLAAGLGNVCRLGILTHHYTCLVRSFPAPFLRTLLADGLVVWRRPDAASAVGITLSFPRHDFEGELMLAFQVDDATIYTMTVTLANGSAMGSNCGCMLLITCLQGGVHQLPLIRRATRACANTPPAYLLLAAVEGMAAVLGAERIVAVGNTRQLAKSRDAVGETLFDYDHFWSCLGGVPTNDGFYLFPARLPEKPLQAFPSRHRSREMRKRDLKRGVAAAVARCLRHASAGSTVPTPPVF